MSGTVVLHHGTTLHRATILLTTPPDADFQEPGGDPYNRAGGISFAPAGSPGIGLGTPETYARLKASNFPSEGGPVILEVEVPDHVVAILLNDPIAALVVASNEYRFEPGLGFEELRIA